MDFSNCLLLIRWCKLDLKDTFQFILSQQLFIKLLGFSYLCAFWSLFIQVLGLYGSQGIIPVQQTLQNMREIDQRKGPLLYLRFPTFFWINSSDWSLKGLAGFGLIASLLVVFGVWPAIWLPLLWLTYLSYVTIGLVFLGFQWDALLLEVGFVGIFFAIESPPPMMLLLALWILLFRFIFSSGAVKLLSGCPEWRQIQAMTYHYETQPIPNKVAYFMHQQAKWFSKISEVGVYFFELAVPFLILGTNKMRLVACLLLIFFQILIFVTGNYAFFNILSVALCIPLLTNSSLEWLMGSPSTLISPVHPIVHGFLEVIGTIFFVLNIMLLVSLFIYSKTIYKVLNYLSLYYLINPYGLFARMTTNRDEIIIEGSMDGQEWKVYEFKWKPGDLREPPKQVAPYHPRLDWQMWFAALSNYRANPWLINFMVRLLEGSQPVQKLLKINPFPDAPPKYIRAHLYQYHFSDLATLRKTGEWWVRTYKGLYTPVLSLKSS